MGNFHEGLTTHDHLSPISIRVWLHEYYRVCKILDAIILLNRMDGGVGGEQGSLAGALKTDTVLILFVEIVIVIIYLVSLLLVVVRRARRLLELHNRKYYIVVVLYVASKLILCIVLLIQVVVGMTNSWSNIEPAQVELIIKTAIVLADFSMIELFLVALETYLSHCLSAVSDAFSRRRSRLLGIALKGLQAGVAVLLIIPMILFDVGELSYTVLNALAIGLNLLIIISFLVTFFYLNFKMTGIMMESRLNAVIRRIYKVQLIILISRVTSLTFQAMLALYVFPATFQQKIDEEILGGLTHEVMLALVFVGSVLFILITEGLPIMYSLRSTVVHALNHKSQFLEYSPFTDHTSGVEDTLMHGERREQAGENGALQKLRLKDFKNMVDVSDKEDSIWITKKGSFKGKEYLVRISKREISSYIFEDIENEIAYLAQLRLKGLSQVNYFCEGQIVHLVENYYETTLDDRVEQANSEKEALRLALGLANCIRELHENGLVHGSLSPGRVFVEGEAVVVNGLGLHSLKKYLSLVSGYGNKSLYTAVEHLRDKNSVVLKPNKPADVYSFGIILYEMVTLNRHYRQLPLRDVELKFAEENFRPKLPDKVKHDLKQLIRRCWHELADNRPSIEEVIDILRRVAS